MSRYIDYDAIDYRNDRLHDKSEEFLNGVIYMAQRIEEAPSIDIVRCGECWHGTDIKNGKKFCIRCDIMDDLLMIADGFCNSGERSSE